ncbi:PQQ-binding-like beta-propeller repeat protein [Streptomyces sp. NPDC017993]|uniref:protein kinase domain-containing protein n=1 Tax=Streptomyces sp. NPDC017993 TaxID=3365027 RepID=UPI0037A5E26E
MPSLRDSGGGPEAERPEYAGQYRLEARLGSGGMGVVHLARSSSGLLLAVKVIHAEFAQDPEFRGRFRQEVAAARRVSGAFTAPVVDADPDAARPWMATLHIPGPTLSDHVKRNGPLAPAEVRRLASGLAEALRDIHRAGVVHRDLKPGNVLLAADGPKVIDFGISRPSDSEMRTETGKLIGTPPFMAPEQFQRPREVGPAADVFALGSVLVHAATGSGPFDSESPYIVAYQVVHDEADLTGVPPELAPLIEGCLAKHPEDRPTPDALMARLHSDTPTEVHDRLHAELLDELHARARGGAASGPGEGESGGPAAGGEPAGTDGAVEGAARIPGQRRPVRAESAPQRADATHVRARMPVAGPVDGVPAPPSGTAGTPLAGPVPGAARPADDAVDDAGAGTAPPDARRPEALGPEGAPPAGPVAPTGPAGTAGHPDAGRPGRPHPLRRRAVRAAVALVVAGAAAFAGFQALSDDAPGQDPALQTHPPRADRAAFHPWRTALIERPEGYRAEMPFCTMPPAGGSGRSSADTGAVFCAQSGVRATRLTPDTGRLAWRRTADSHAKTDMPPSAPVLSGGLLYVFTPDGKRLEALDPSAEGRGATRWSKDVSGYEGGALVIGDRVLLTAGDGTVTALDSATHRQRWRKKFPDHGLAAFATFGDPHTAFAAEPGPDGGSTQLTAIDPADGRLRWQKRLPGSLMPAGVGASGDLYLTATDPTFTFSTTAVVRYDPKTGHTRRLKLNAPLDGVSAVVHGETAYLLAEGGALQAVGERRWDVETSVSRGSAPVVNGDRLYFSAADGRLMAVDTTKGAMLGQTPPRLSTGRHHGFLETLPVPLVDAPRGRIYAASPDGTVFATATKDPAGW